MKNTTLLALVALTSFTAAAGDLELPGARWLAKTNGYVCAGDTAKNVEAPAGLASIGASFETVVTDYSLDNGLLKASFQEDGVVCHYSALIFADNAAKTLKLVQSHAYAEAEASACTAGKAVLDDALAQNVYIWKERPRPAHLTILVADENAAAICGAGVNHLGIDFILAGMIK